MDLLDSILGSMEKPPTVKKPEIKDKEKREKFEKLQRQRKEAARKQKEQIDKFRDDITRRIRDFVNAPTSDDPETNRLKLATMSKIYRSIVREACDNFEDEIVVHSFGTEEVDRHCVIWRKGYEPCEEEIRAMKLGVEYKPKNEGDESDEGDQEKSSEPPEGKDKFWSKYEKVIGENAYGLESARVALPAKQYGCVPIDLKKDQRSIEQMMDDIRRSKRQKTTGSDEPGTSEGGKAGEDEEEEPPASTTTTTRRTHSARDQVDEASDANDSDDGDD